ncbi:sex peptide receptor-like [Planococcus citri]|uniref:sex peptide receptor-like n=1 Tax=Planococcus citri TaxID=170843 RepID=UPI0031F7BF7E
MSTEEQFCGSTLLKIGEFYTTKINGYVDIPICIIGSVLNIFNILIFTRKNMISSPNFIFTHIAFVDLLLLIAFIPFTYICYILYGGYSHGRWSYGQAVFLMYCYEFILTFHSISVFLTIMLALWRYIALAHPFKETQWCNMETTRKVVAAGYTICILFSVPMYLSGVIIPNPPDDQMVTTYTHMMKNDTILPKVYFVTAGLLHSFLPSVLLPVFIIRIIVILLAKKEDQRHLHPSLNPQISSSNLKKNQQTDRSIMALITVLTLFLIIKVLDGILNLTYMIYGSLNRSTKHCFYGPRSILLTATEIDMSITFVIYYTMSENFRDTFKGLFRRTSVALGNNRNPDTGRKIDQV